MPRITILSTAHIHTEGFLKRLAEAAGGTHLVWDDVAERGRDFAERFGARFTADLAEAVADAETDGFVICAENTRHAELLRAAVPAGKPVMCEKPLTTASADARAVLELVEEHGTPITTGYFMPFGGAMQGVAAALEEGTLGTLTHVGHRNAHQGGYGRWFDSEALAWFAKPELSGGGALLDLGTHSVHLLRTLFGPVREVWADIGNRSGVYPAVDDHGIIHLRFASGLLGTVEAAWIHRGGRGGLECFGDQGALWQQGQEVWTKPADGDAAVLAAGTAQPDRIDRLLAVVNGELPEAAWRADLEAAADAVAILEAAYASAESGSWQAVPACLPQAHCSDSKTTEDTEKEWQSKIR